MTYTPTKPQGPYTLWQDNGTEGWNWRDFATLKEALESSERYSSNWVIHRQVAYDVQETSDYEPL